MWQALHGEVSLGMVLRGGAGTGKAWHGWHGKVGWGLARRVLAWQAWSAKARHRKMRFGTAG